MEVIYVDTGGGKYDHHETDAYVCAASLVMKDIGLGKNPVIKRMVDYVLKIDHGLLFETDVNDFDMVNIIEGLNALNVNKYENTVKTALYCLDAVYESLKAQEEAELDLGKIQTFKTKWGKGAALSTSNKKVRYLCHRKGYIVFVYVDPLKGYRGFTAPGGSDVDFSGQYERLSRIEPQADWFLHRSKELLLCGSAKAPDRRLSSLSLKQMINLVKI